MLKYYSYYSVGGYKDMYLGNSEMKEEYTYLLPLVPVWEKRAKDNGDAELLATVEKLKELPSIKLLNRSELFGFPKGESIIVSHGGYKIILKHCPDGECILAVRDILGDSKDENGRAIPYLISIVGQSQEDKESLCWLCYYVMMNFHDTMDVLSKLFKYDVEKNGICFRLSFFSNWIQNALSKKEENSTSISYHNVAGIINTRNILVIPEQINVDLALKEQALAKDSVRIIRQECINKKNEGEKAESIEKALSKSQGAVPDLTLPPDKKTYFYTACGIVAAIALLGLIALIRK